MTRAFNRRELLRLGLLGVSIAGTYPAFLAKTLQGALPESAASDRALVVLQLSGGNDGLSTLVPYSDPEYGRARSTTRLEEKDVLKLDERVGLHPGLKELKASFDEGEVAIVQGVSYPNPTRSHFEAMDIWHCGDQRGARLGTGWLGRALDSTCGNKMNPLAGVNLGDGIPLALRGEKTKPVAFKSPDNYQWRGGKAEKEAFTQLNSPEGDLPAEARPGDFLRRVAVEANESSEAILKATRGYRGRAEYPRGNRLAEDLQRVAAMLAAGLPTRVYYVSLSGFDTHAHQRGTHDNLMKTLSGAVAGFFKDLKAQGLDHRVLLLTFSEFGRRVKENGSRGTDHGAALPLFLVGSRARGGLHGKHPSLSALVDGDLALSIDFRQVYATVLDHWLGAPAERVLGRRWEPLPLIKGVAREGAF
jgi:uncharacterized protein (DUF1501 family)